MRNHTISGVSRLLFVDSWSSGMMSRRLRAAAAPSQSRSALAVAVEVSHRVVAELIEVSAVDGGADVVQQLHEEMLVVNRGQREAVEFACTKQVIDVCARVVTARVAVASFLQRAEIELVLGAFDVVSARPRVDRAVAGATCGATQSKVSPPFSTQAKMSSTEAMPST